MVMQGLKGAVVAVVALAFSITVLAIPTSHHLLGDFEDGWDRQWRQKSFTRPSNRFEVVSEGDNAVLEVTSSNAAAGLFRDFEINPVESALLSWHWKVERSLTDNMNETDKKGDDYAARVFVIFKSSFLLPWKTKAICYVWAGNESIGAVYKNPYSGGVATIVVQSGDDRAGEWLNEERNIVADYVECFGSIPEKLSGFAVMVDTDQTGAETTAWFDDIIVEFRKGDNRGN
jgi:hypothetical protein